MHFILNILLEISCCSKSRLQSEKTDDWDLLDVAEVVSLLLSSVKAYKVLREVEHVLLLGLVTDKEDFRGISGILGIF